MGRGLHHGMYIIRESIINKRLKYVRTYVRTSCWDDHICRKIAIFTQGNYLGNSINYLTIDELRDYVTEHLVPCLPCNNFSLFMKSSPFEILDLSNSLDDKGIDRLNICQIFLLSPK